MQNSQTSLFARDDTFFGVCQALGEDFGFNPLYLRMAIPVLLFFNPIATIGGYLALGAIVLVSRLLFPNPRVAVAEDTAEREAEPLPLAA